MYKVSGLKIVEYGHHHGRDGALLPHAGGVSGCLVVMCMVTTVDEMERSYLTAEVCCVLGAEGLCQIRVAMPARLSLLALSQSRAWSPPR